jgi:hypothetical protein
MQGGALMLRRRGRGWNVCAMIDQYTEGRERQEFEHLFGRLLSGSENN